MFSSFAILFHTILGVFMSDLNSVLKQRLRELGEKLAQQRKQKNMKQKDLAELCGVSQRVQSGYERGEVAPQVDYLFKLQMNGYDVQSLIASQQGALYELSAREQTVLDLYRHAPIELQLQILEQLAGQAVRTKNNEQTNNYTQTAVVGVQNNQQIKKS